MYRGGSSSFRQIGDHHGAQVPGPFAPFSAPVSPLLWSRHAPLGEPPLVIPPFIRGYRGSTPHTIAPFIYIKRGMYRGGSSSFGQMDHHDAAVTYFSTTVTSV